MSYLAIAMDIGTSGIRAQAVNLTGQEIISTVITARHPLPGANVIDHLHFALEIGVSAAHDILLQSINLMIDRLGIESTDVCRLAVCGNPIQLSLFQGIEIRDLAFAGKRKQQSLAIEVPKREALITHANMIQGLNLPDLCEVIIPPAVEHEIGADALAMIIQSNMQDTAETALITDYGTNAEMALIHQGRIYSGSTAAGPALEGQQISSGMLATPGAIVDLVSEPPYHRLMVLNDDMQIVKGALVDITKGDIIDASSEYQAIGLTGTGTIATIFQAIVAGLIKKPHIMTHDHQINLGEEIRFTEKDFIEAGKAIGSVRSGHITLCHEAGISASEITTVYMSGASGTYMDALKAQKLGMFPAHVKKVCQIGNTSLAMARDLLFAPDKLEEMNRLAKHLKQYHCMFATSPIFKKVFMLELSFWTEGMPLTLYQRFLRKYGLPELDQDFSQPEIIHTVEQDINDMGKQGLITLTDIGQKLVTQMQGCVACHTCVNECPETALHISFNQGLAYMNLDQSLCDGVACRRCERVCQDQVFHFNQFFKGHE